MDKKQEADGDALARQLIAQYWRDFENGDTWNFHSNPGWGGIWYTRTDAWATREKWLAVARRCIEERSNIRQALEVLLAEGCKEYLPVARRFAEEWNEYGGHDAYRFVDILSHFPPGDPLREQYLGYASPAEFDDPVHDQELGPYRLALVAVADEGMCRYLAGEISKVFDTPDPDYELAFGYALPRMSELGRLCKELLSPTVLSNARQWCLAQLEKDKAMIERGERAGDGERERWVRNAIAPWSWKIGWPDVLERLQDEGWYWSWLFSDSYCDYGNINLLTWSLVRSDDLLKTQALLVMQTNAYLGLGGAIAWSRLRKWQPGEVSA
jgi:hypothetical protein